MTVQIQLGAFGTTKVCKNQACCLASCRFFVELITGYLYLNLVGSTPFSYMIDYCRVIGLCHGLLG